MYDRMLKLGLRKGAISILRNRRMERSHVFICHGKNS